MISEIDLELRDILARIYSPDFKPSAKLCELLACTGGEQGAEIKAKIIQGIEALKPSPDVPAASRMARSYELLHNRFVLRLTLEETALRMHMSLSSTWREQRSAIHALATQLWQLDQSRSVPDARESSAGSEQKSASAPVMDWQEQTRRELASLHSQAPDVFSVVSTVVQQVVELERNLLSRKGVTLEVGSIKPDLTARVHPSVLRQILIIAIGQFLRKMSAGKISLFGRQEDGAVKITVAGVIDSDPENFEQALTAELPLPGDSSVEVYREDRSVFLWITLPSQADWLTVLVVDDNLDMVHYYQRSTEGTGYHIVALEGEMDLFAAAHKVKPEIILLDVMLPHADGWELLMQLRANPLTRSIPVIICSVVKEEELALSLGAARFISKPVSAQELVQALDQVLSQTP